MMRYEREIANPEKLIEWGIKGVYNELGLERTFCSCGYVHPGRVYVCPKCGATEFQNTKDWQGKIATASTGETYLNPIDLALYDKTKVLYVKRDKSHPDLVEFVEFSDRLSVNRKEKEYVEAMLKYRDFLDEKQTYALELAEVFFDKPYPVSYDTILWTIDTNFTRYKNFVNGYLKKGRYNFLAFLLSSMHERRISISDEATMIRELGIPSCFHKDLDDPKVLRLLKALRIQNLSEFESRWNRIPPDIQAALLNYMKQSLINDKQFAFLAAISFSLLEENADAQMKFLKKYFANCQIREYSWRGDNEEITAEQIYEYYAANNIPILADNFDLRAYFSMLNTQKILEFGLPAVEVSKNTNTMDTSPLDSFVAISKLRKPRKKKTP